MRRLHLALALCAWSCSSGELEPQPPPGMVTLYGTNGTEEAICGVDVVPTTDCGPAAANPTPLAAALEGARWKAHGGTVELGVYPRGTYDLRARLRRTTGELEGRAFVQLQVLLDSDLDGEHFWTIPGFDAHWTEQPCWGTTPPPQNPDFHPTEE